jgi:hypothetical protein
MKDPILPLLFAALCTMTVVRAESAKPTPSASPTASTMPVERPTPSAQEFQLAFGKITIGDKEVATALEWNTRTGEARMLNAATFSDKETGQQGNIVGWVPVVDLQQAFNNLASQIQANKQDPAKSTSLPAASPTKTP